MIQENLKNRLLEILITNSIENIDYFAHDQKTTFLPLLELSIGEAKILIEELYLVYSPNSSSEKFPFCSILLHGLNWELPYWREKAVSWIEQGFPLNSQIIDALEMLYKDKSISQKVRHKVHKILKDLSGPFLIE